MHDKIRDLIDKSLTSVPIKSIGEKSAKLKPGCFFVFNMPVEVPVQWFTAMQHPDDEKLWFAIAGDNFPTVGTRDVEIPDTAECGPINLRCQFGVWIHADDFTNAIHFGETDTIFVEQVRDRLSRMRKGDLPTDPTIVEADSDPDYLEWMDELADAVYAFETQLEEPQKNRIVSFSTDWASGLELPATFHALAADSSDLSKVPRVESQTPMGAAIEFAGPGNLVAMKYREGVLFQIFGLLETDATPSLVANESVLNWEEERDGWFTTGEITSWNDSGMVEFSVNGEKLPAIER